MDTLNAYLDKIKVWYKTETSSPQTEGGMTMYGVVSFVVGLCIGLFILGWFVFPVQYEAPEYTANNLPIEVKALVVNTLSEHYALTGNTTTVFRFVQAIDDIDTVACTMAGQENSDFGRKARLITIAGLKNGYGCN